MEHVRSFTNFPTLLELQKILAANDSPFETSELYSSVQDAKIVDVDKRKSVYRLFQDKEIFDLVDQTVQWLNKSDEEYSYQLRRDDVTETRYDTGGFFLKHKDYLSVTSNLVEEFTLILCVTPPNTGKVEGGETLLFPYASEKGTAFDTVTPGNGLLFRKDLEHAGNVLKSGEKHILTANLWATRKQSSNQVLFVTFPSSSAEQEQNETEARLKQVANQDTSYALPVDCLKGTMLESHVHFVNRGYEQIGEDLPSVVNYSCEDFTFDEFGTVAKILLRLHVDEEAINKHATCLDYFGPFAAENLLVRLALEKTTLGPDPPSCSRFTKSADGDQKLPSRKKKKQATTKANSDDTKVDDLDVIVCENESRTEVVNTVARQLGYNNYVPFKMLFVEGMVVSGFCGNRQQNVPVTPVALLLGDYNHIFAIQNICRKTNVEILNLQKCHEENNYWTEERIRARSGEDRRLFDELQSSYDEDQWEAELEAYRDTFAFSLKFALGEASVREAVLGFVFCTECEGRSTVRNHNGFECFEPLSRYSGPRPLTLSENESDGSGSSKSGDEVSGEEDVNGSAQEKEDTAGQQKTTGDESEDEGKGGGTGQENAGMSSSPILFHRNEFGKATFTWDEATAASNFIASMNLDERVKASKYHTLPL